MFIYDYEETGIFINNNIFIQNHALKGGSSIRILGIVRKNIYENQLDFENVTEIIM